MSKALTVGGLVEGVMMSFLLLQSITSKLNSICDQILFLKSKCHTFVKDHLGQLIKELMTDDGVRTICIKAGACK